MQQRWRTPFTAAATGDQRRRLVGHGRGLPRRSRRLRALRAQRGRVLDPSKGERALNAKAVLRSTDDAAAVRDMDGLLIVLVAHSLHAGLKLLLVGHVQLDLRLEEDLPLQRGGAHVEHRRLRVDEHIAQRLTADGCEPLLLRRRQVQLQRDEDRVRRRDEGGARDRRKHGFGRDARRERVAVQHLRLAARAVPAVDLDAAAPLQQHTLVHARVRRRRELAARQVGVVRALDEVVGERLRHRLADGRVRRVEEVVGLREQQPLQLPLAQALPPPWSCCRARAPAARGAALPSVAVPTAANAATV